MIKPVTLIIFLLIASPPAWALDPAREKGVTVHLLPERVGRMVGDTGGFVVRPQHIINERRLFPTAEAFFSYFMEFSGEVIANGIWVVTSNPTDYPESELKRLDQLVELCRAREIPLFVTRASSLPNGWEKLD